MIGLSVDRHQNAYSQNGPGTSGREAAPQQHHPGRNRLRLHSDGNERGILESLAEDSELGEHELMRFGRGDPMVLKRVIPVRTDDEGVRRR